MKFVVLGLAAIALFGQDQKPPAPPEYFDEPKFIVAGVADPSQRGGHGSDPVFAFRRKPRPKRPQRFATGLAAAEQGNPLEAVRAYQRAAERDPSEGNLFDWGTELLTHLAADQAVEVFTSGHRLFPRSTRTLLGLAVALYSRGSYDQAAQRFFEAADFDPNDPAPYLFLGKISSGAIRNLDGYAQRLERFAQLHPDSAWANYYYAATLTGTPLKAQALLERAVRLDPKLGKHFCCSELLTPTMGIFPKRFQPTKARSRPTRSSKRRTTVWRWRIGKLARQRRRRRRSSFTRNYAGNRQRNSNASVRKSNNSSSR